MSNRLLKDPLIQFIVLGAVLFAGIGLWDRYIAKRDYLISVDPAEIERRALIFASENRRAPTEDDIQALTFAYVEEIVLAREARRLGLDEDDTIIERRLAQKMRFILESGEPPKPDAAMLSEWFNDNQARFATPALRSFSQIFISPATNGTAQPIQVDQRAAAIKSRVTPENWTEQGDPFMLGPTFNNVSQQTLVTDFGAAFAKALFDLPTESNWQGPIESAFGLHLVRIDRASDEKPADFEAVRGQVETAWRDEAKRQANSERLRELIRSYTIDIGEPDQ